jgi:DNA-binding Xre family transcriptional regulator
MSMLRWAIGIVLRRIRNSQGRTLRDVAYAAGVSIPYLSEIERGRKEASSEILAGICRALGIRLVDLLEEVRAELLRAEPAPVPVPRPGPHINLHSVGCLYAEGRSAQGRSTSRRSLQPRMLVTCSKPRRRTTPSFSTSS